MPTEPADAGASDPVGATTLHRLSVAGRFNRWMYERIARHVGDRVLEIGAGIGNISQHLVGRDRVILTEPDDGYRRRLAQRFGADPRVSVEPLALPDIPARLRGEALDTIVCLNVLEHVAQDHASLVAMRDVLRPGGRAVILVPALPALFGTLDEALGHCRRYTPDRLRTDLAAAGFATLAMEYFNLAGIPGWWVVGRLLRRRILPGGSLRLYDALVPLFRLERFLPRRVGLSLIGVGARPA